jgi:hypothetical protein
VIPLRKETAPGTGKGTNFMEDWKAKLGCSPGAFFLLVWCIIFAGAFLFVVLVFH